MAFEEEVSFFILVLPITRLLLLFARLDRSCSSSSLG
jgi:hypothetical protein